MVPRWLWLPLLLSCSWSSAQDLRSGGALPPEQAAYDVRHYNISIDLDIPGRSINGTTEVRLRVLKPVTGILLNLWDSLGVQQAWLNGKPVPLQREAGDRLRIAPGQMLQPGLHHVRVLYGGKAGIAARAPWSGGFQFETDREGRPWVAISCQGEGGKIFFPCKDHPSDKPDEGADLRVTVPGGLVVAGPGILQSTRHRRNRSTFHWQTTYPIHNYSLVFNVGNYRTVTRPYRTCEGRTVPMVFYVLPDNLYKAQRHLDLLEQSLRVQEKYFGEYPWVREKIGLVETPHLGMEHQTLNAYGNKFQYTKVGGEDFDWLMHHELGHEWWGNKVSNADWAHMWIQEGICSYGDALYTLEKEGREAYLARMRQTALRIQNRRPLVQGDAVDSDDTYQPDIYGKGAFFMHTLGFVMGDSLLLTTLRRFAAEPAYTYANTVTSEDVERYFSTAAGRSLRPLFDLYLRSTNRFTIQVKQMPDNVYAVSLPHLEGEWPVAIRTDGITLVYRLSRQPVELKSPVRPEPDPDGYYFKRIIWD